MPEDQSLRVPPHSIEAEAAVLAAMLVSEESVFKAFEILRPECFYNRKNSLIAEAINSIFDRNETVDLVTVSEELKKQKKLAEASGLDYLSSLAENVVAPAHVEYHARIVYEKWVQRKLINVVADIAQKAYESGQSVDEMLDWAEHQIFEIKESKLRRGFVALRDLLVPAMRTIDKAKQEGRHITGVPTGLDDLDRITSGFQRGELVIVAGRPSMGKSSLALNISVEAAKRAAITVGVFSLEMTTEMIVERIICSEAGVSLTKLRSGRLSMEDYARLSNVMGVLNELNIYIDDTPSMSILELKAKARRLYAEGEIGMIIVDYMQLMDASAGFSGQRNRQQEITEISRSLKALAKEINAPVVALSQLSRRPEMREDKRPQLADLRESGSIEQDADLVLLIHRPGFYDSKVEEGQPGSPTKVIVAKQRNGPTGEVDLVFLKSLMRFESYVGREEDAFAPEEETEEMDL
ncbi:replicative DNA helicase [candidate division WOR-3 bacterium]|nr:replicative DNA helicase [candidate division WOR-3 bacterium]